MPITVQLGYCHHMQKLPNGHLYAQHKAQCTGVIHTQNGVLTSYIDAVNLVIRTKIVSRGGAVGSSLGS